MSMEDYIEVENLSLDDWLALVFKPPKNKIFLRTRFPTVQHGNEYIATINKRSEKDVRRLIECLVIQTGSIEFYDRVKLEALIRMKKEDPERYNKVLELQYFKRSILHYSGYKEVPPWEGITWILDLLPHFPKQALSVLDAYILAHYQLLPDQRIYGLYDVAEIIRAKFIGLPGTREEVVTLLKSLSSREFEHLVERLYHQMGYETRLTPASKDGGRDILAQKQDIAQREHLLIECKKHEDPVEVAIPRALLGVVSSEKVNKGVIVTTSRFTRGSKSFTANNPRLELIDGDSLVGLLNTYLGSKWPLRIERLVAESLRHNSSQ